jgi:hypothetical protein
MLTGTRQSICQIDAFLENYILGTLIVENNEAYLLLSDGKELELDNSYRIEVINGIEYHPITYEQAINTHEKYMKTPLYAGMYCRVRRIK